MLRNNLFVAYTAALLFLFSPSANAGFVVNVSEIGGGVFVEGAGNIDLTGLSLDPTNPSLGATFDPDAFFLVGPATPTTFDTFVTPSGSNSGPFSIGTGTIEISATSGSGDLFGLDFSNSFLSVGVPDGYISGSPLDSSSIFVGHTLGTLGLTPGTYIWTAGVNTIELNITAVPEPSSLLMLVVGIGAALVRRQQRAVSHT